MPRKSKLTPEERIEQLKRMLEDAEQRRIAQDEAAMVCISKAAWLFESLVNEPSVLASIPVNVRHAIKAWLGIDRDVPLTPASVEKALDHGGFNKRDTNGMRSAGGELASRAIFRR